MELRTVNTFLHVAELQGFSRAAEALGYSQSTITAQIQQLESELQTPLFDRIGRTIRLTPKGEEFLEYAKQLISLSEQATAAIRALPPVNGMLRLAIADSLCSSYLPPVLKAYHRLYPHVQLSIITADTTDMFEMLYHNEADLVYTLDRRIARADLISNMEMLEPVSFFCAPSHPLAQQDTIPLKTLCRQEFILTEPGMSYRSLLDEFLSAHALAIEPFVQIGDVEIIRTLAEAGEGICFLPDYAVAQSVENGQLCRLSVPACRLTVWRQLLCHRRKHVTPAMQAMIEILRR